MRFVASLSAMETSVTFIFLRYFLCHVSVLGHPSFQHFWTFSQDYHTQRPRGFAFVEFYDSRDAADALDHLDRYEMDGREIAVVFAKDRRKTADEMRPRGGGGGRDSRDRRGGGRDRERRDSRDR